MEALYIAIITSLVSGILTFVVTYFTTQASMKQELAKMKYNYDARLLEERLKYYPELFRLTQDIGKNNTSSKTDLVKVCQEIAKKMNDWKGAGTGFIVLSGESYQAFSDLKKQLKKNPVNPKEGYSQEVQDKIWKLRGNLRNSLKQDLGINMDDYKDI